RDGRIDAAELPLDSEAKITLISSLLEAAGIESPQIERRVTLHPLSHGVMAGAQVQGNCARCHTDDSQLAGTLALSRYVPWGLEGDPVLPSAPPIELRRAEVTGGSGGVGADPTVDRLTNGAAPTWLASAPRTSTRYVFGHSRHGWTDRLGFTLFALTALGVFLHAALRWFQARRRPVPTFRGQKVYLYRRYERIWHWLMAGSILVLMMTGLAVHYSGSGTLPLPIAVRLHNVFAVILVVNAFLSLFYHVSTSTIRQFFPDRRGLLGRISEQAHFYVRGLFVGQPHPQPKSMDRKLNPLQQVTYLVLLNLLFPLQMLTGIAIWGIARWPGLADAIGGLSVVAPLHNAGSWLFLAFFVLHVYLTTTGHTVLSNIQAMIDGHDLVEVEPRSRVRSVGEPLTSLGGIDA
ncbi:MAG: cytochrome b/b6 domain-containing protein, partial [Candidatus Eisenbacteria bacterium]